MTDSKQYWDNRYKTGGNSGYGSYGDQLAKKLMWLKNLEGIKTISEIGCGDFNFGEKLLEIYPKAKYIGSDISPEVIRVNQGKWPDHIFRENNDEVPAADLVLCIDVLFHVLHEGELEELLKGLEKRWTKYLAITAYERDEQMEGHVRIRRFDYRRFGEPIIRQVVEEDGQLYFYLFKRPDIKPQEVSCCLITKESNYPFQILHHLSQQGFGEILVLTNCDSPYRKYELFNKAKYDYIYYQDDDAICPVPQVFSGAKRDMINVAMKESHFNSYSQKRMTMGLGWGSIFNKSVLESLKKYTDRYGEDDLFKRDTEKVLTELNFPQNRMMLPVVDLPSAWDQNRLSFEPQHYTNATMIEERCKELWQ